MKTMFTKICMFAIKEEAERIARESRSYGFTEIWNYGFTELRRSLRLSFQHLLYGNRIDITLRK